MAAGADFDPAVRVEIDDCLCGWCERAVCVDAVVEVDAADSVSEDVAEWASCGACLGVAAPRVGVGG